MSTTFMLMNNPMDLIMNLVVNTTVNTDKMALEGAIEKYKVDFDAKTKQAIFTFKMYGSSKFYKLRIVADAKKEFRRTYFYRAFFPSCKYIRSHY